MRKQMKVILFVMSMMVLWGLMNTDMASASFVECLSNDVEYRHIIETRRQNEGIVSAIYFDEQKLFYDRNKQTFYYSLVEESSSAYNPKIKVKSEYDSVSVLVLGNITDEQIENNVTISMLVYNEESYYLYNLKCTTLPLMNLDVELELSREEVPMTMVLFDNRKGAANRVITSNGAIKVRGASSAKLEKTSYRMKLTKETLGENTRANCISLLGMRQDEDWLLYAPFNDQEKVRNVFNTNLWTESCGTNNELKIQTGVEYKFFELFINEEYMGLYALGYPIDEKLMEIDGTLQETLYKKVYFGTAFDFTYAKNSKGEVTVNGYDVKTIEKMQENDIYERWKNLLEYYQWIYENRDDSEVLKQSIDIDNAIDTYLFLNLIQSRDTVSGGRIKNMYMYIHQEDNTQKMLYAPWDMDLTWGNVYSDNIEMNFVSPHQISPKENTCMLFGPLNQLLLNETPDIFERIFERYRELRKEAWSTERINALIDSYESNIYGSGAYRRECERWPNGTQTDAAKGLDIFRTYVIDRLHVVDEYYKDLEDDWKSGEYEIELSKELAFTAEPMGCPDLKLYLTLLSFSNYDKCIEVRNEEIYEDAYYKSLLEQAGVEHRDVIVNEELEADVHIILLETEIMSIVDDVYFIMGE